MYYQHSIDSQSDSYYDYSDVEYNTVEPYDYELNNFTCTVVEQTKEEKLLLYIERGDIDQVKQLLPELLKAQIDVKVCNNKTLVTVNGDISTDYSDNDLLEDNDDVSFKDSGDASEVDEDDSLEQQFNAKIKEVLFQDGGTPLMIASASANVELVEYILSLGVDVNYKDTNSNNCAVLSLVSNLFIGWRLIHRSWRINAPKCLKLLIDAGANVNVKGYLSSQESGYTALHYAARNDYWDMLDLLISAGADLDAMTNQKETALMLAGTLGHVACCNILLLAGANDQLMDRGGATAAYMAGIEGHKTLSDAISVYSGCAQHNMDLYKIWSQYIQNESDSSIIDRNSPEIIDNLSTTCIEAFCLAIDAPYLVSIMREQGVTISDLKVMSNSKLKELGVSEDDCDKIIVAMQDVYRKVGCKNRRISFEYGKPLRMVTLLEMLGNISEHMELLATNLDCWYINLNKKYQTDMVLYKCTITKLQYAATSCMPRVVAMLEQIQQLKSICDHKKNCPATPKVDNDQRQMSTIKEASSLSIFTVITVSVVTVSLSVALLYRRTG